MMEGARKAKKKTREGPPNLKRRKPTNSDGTERKQQSLVELFARQQRRLESRIALEEDKPDYFCEILEEQDVEQLSKAMTAKVSKREGTLELTLSASNKNSTSDGIIDKSLKEFLEEDDSLFSDSVLGYSSQSDSQGTSFGHMPYYVKNFKEVIQSVFYDHFFEYLFDDTDRSTVDLYLNKLTLPQQKLYSRVFLRKYRWLRIDQLLYNDIEENISVVADSLVSTGMLVDVSLLTDLNETLKCLNAAELKLLAKSLQLNPSLSRAELISTIENHSKTNSIASFFSKTSPAVSNIILKKAKQQLGPCYKLEEFKRSTFIRIMMLSSLCNTISDDDFSGHQQIFQMLSTSLGLTKFPVYTLSRQSKVFRDRQSLIRYSEVLEFESRLWQKCEKKKYEEAFDIYKKAKDEFHTCLHASPDSAHVESLPIHLRVFTPGAAFVRILSRGVSILQFLGRFEEAVEQLKELLSQKHYHLDCRGRWFDRLTLNLDFHLKRPMEALNYIVEALSDSCIQTGHRLDILNRGNRILSSKKIASFQKRDKICLDNMNFIPEARRVTIFGHQLKKPVPSSGGSVWLFDKEDFKVMSGVEQFAMEHYSNEGYPEGIHGEGLTFTTLFNLLCWDVVFADNVPDAFYNHFQTSPLDLRTNNFYGYRESLFREKFGLLSSASITELEGMVEDSWEENYGTLCSGLNWELFRDVDHVKGLVRSCGGKTLAGIFERMAKQMRFVTGGVPDLVVWDPVSMRVKFVEVKGPGDKLSSKQILWLDYLVSLGACAEVCHVEAKSSKKLKT